MIHSHSRNYLAYFAPKSIPQSHDFLLPRNHPFHNNVSSTAGSVHDHFSSYFEFRYRFVKIQHFHPFRSINASYRHYIMRVYRFVYSYNIVLCISHHYTTHSRRTEGRLCTLLQTNTVRYIVNLGWRFVNERKIFSNRSPRIRECKSNRELQLCYFTYVGTRMVTMYAEYMGQLIDIELDTSERRG